jgi:hypothetical protein
MFPGMTCVIPEAAILQSLKRVQLTDRTVPIYYPIFYPLNKEPTALHK